VLCVQKTTFKLVCIRGYDRGAIVGKGEGGKRSRQCHDKMYKKESVEY
jgi:hypothetical protein